VFVNHQRVSLTWFNPGLFDCANFLWLMTGDRQSAQITRQVQQLVRSGVEVVIATRGCRGYVIATRA
jgi:hypothetical protein